MTHHLPAAPAAAGTRPSHRRRLLATVSAAAVLGAGSLLLHGTAGAAAGADRLNPAEQLGPGERLVSPNGQYVLVMQGDGNLVEYAPGNRPVWASGTGRANSIARMQADGNLVVIAPGNVPVWSTGTSGNPGADVELQSDSNVVVYARGHAARWASASSRPAPAPAPALAPAPAPPPQGPSDPKNPPAAGGTTVSGPAPFPVAGVEDRGGHSTCPFTPQIVEPLFYNPRAGTAPDGSPRVEDVVGVETTNSGCGNRVTFILQTKVCGFFGCNWRNLDQETYTSLPTNGRLISRLLTAPLRSGTNRYRVEADITTAVIEAENEPGPGIIAPVLEMEQRFGQGVELTRP